MDGRPEENKETASKLFVFDESITSLYRRFIVTGFGRVFVSRIASLLYIIIISRIVPDEVQDVMVILLTSMAITSLMTLFGYSYSLVQSTISRQKASLIYTSSSFAVVIGLPLNVVINLAISIAVGLPLFTTSLFLIANVFYYILELVLIIENARVRSDRHMLLRSLYSIISSISVPSLYYFFQSLDGIILAWIGSLILTGLLDVNLILVILKNIKWNPSEALSISKFGLLIYVTQVFLILSRQGDRYILFIFSSPGETALYYWIEGISRIALELFMILLTGAHPLFARFIAEDEEKFTRLFNSLVKFSYLMGGIIFFSVLLNSKLIVSTLIGDQFLVGYRVLIIFALALFIQSPIVVITTSYSAKNDQKPYVVSSMIEVIFKFAFIIILLDYGALGFAVAFLISQIFKVSYLIYISSEYLTITEWTRYIGLLLVWGVLVFLSPQSADLENRIVTNILWIILIVGTLILLKPLTSSDLHVINIIVPRKILDKIGGLIRMMTSSKVFAENPTKD